MRDFESPGRSVAFAASAMAATSHPLATLTALDVLRRGGNAVDGAIAAAAVLCVVEPHMTGIGGDCFVLYAPASGGIVAINGSGCAPAAASLERLRTPGTTSIAATSPHAVTVPGALAAWEMLQRTHGRTPLAELLRPAIACAEDGFILTPRVAWDWLRAGDRLQASPAASDFYLPGGRAPEAGRRLRLPALGRSLRRIAEGGAAAFYTGELAERMVASLRSFGGLHTLDDFAGQRAERVEAIHTLYRDTTVYECPPNGQGVVALLMLNILERFELTGLPPVGAARLHLLAEATRLAYRDRDAALADPLHADVPTDRLLDKAYAKELAGLIDFERALAAPPRVLEEHGDTTYLTVVDADLNAVSLINSLYDSFGSGLVCPDTGIVFHSRGKAFRLDPAHPNAIAPRKRPMHTIIPGLAFRRGELWCSFGVMGGDFQPVGHAQLMAHLIDDGMDPQTAMDQPRAMAYPSDLQVESGIAPGVRRELARKGHRVIDASAPLGGGQAIVIDRKRGVLIGGSDPRKDGLALGY